jgi:hypothetical protein
MTAERALALASEHDASAAILVNQEDAAFERAAAAELRAYAAGLIIHPETAIQLIQTDSN